MILTLLIALPVGLCIRIFQISIHQQVELLEMQGGLKSIRFHYLCLIKVVAST